MNDADARFVLSVAATYDNRPPSQAMASAWAFDLGDIDRDAAAQAVREHYRENPDTWIKPGHVLDILKAGRKTAVSQSSRLEFELLRAIDPDAEDYDRQVQEALRQARSAPSENPAAIPAQQRALPRRPVTPEERAEAARRGKELAAQSIAAATPYRLGRKDAAEVPENLRKAREVAAEYRAGKAYRDKSMKLGAAGAEVLQKINRQRAQSREGGSDGRP